MSKKHELGQFMTKKYEYILSGITIPDVNHIIEPMAGECDLLNTIKDLNKYELIHKNSNATYKLECYDIDSNHPFVIKRDTIKNPPDYKNKYIITNPPYLARNKTEDKELFDKYNVNDLYKCLIAELCVNIADGGVLIIPLNFWSSIRKADIELRKHFLQKYSIEKMNIFEESVFDDTDATVCSFKFKNINTNNLELDFDKLSINKKCIIEATIYPIKKVISDNFNDDNNYMFGGQIYNLIHKNKYTITRLTSKNLTKKNTNIVAKCIDDNINSKIGLSYVADDKIYIDDTPNQSARTYATLIIEPAIDIDTQKKLVLDFNEYLNHLREQYHSLFLTNYRESKDIARKRISFELVYNIVGRILDIYRENQ